MFKFESIINNRRFISFNFDFYIFKRRITITKQNHLKSKQNPGFIRFVTHQSYKYLMSPHHAFLHLKVLLQKFTTTRTLARESMQDKTINSKIKMSHTSTQHSTVEKGKG